MDLLSGNLKNNIISSISTIRNLRYLLSQQQTERFSVKTRSERTIILDTMRKIRRIGFKASV